MELAEQVELVFGFGTRMNSLTVECLPHSLFTVTVVFMEMNKTMLSHSNANLKQHAVR